MSRETNQKYEVFKNKKKIIAIVILMMSSIILIYASYQIIYWVKSNIELKRMEEVLAEVVTIEKNEDENGAETKTIDFEKLLEMNKDVIGWISIENTKVDYPIVQSKNNEYYLKRDINKKKSSCGSIYLDYKAQTDFSDENTIIFGHNLKSGEMFGDLKKIYNGDLGTDIVIEIYTQDSTNRYQVRAAYIAEPTNEIMKRNLKEEEKNEYLEKAIQKSKVQFDNPTQANGKLLTLITCYGEKRTVIQASKIEETTVTQL